MEVLRIDSPLENLLEPGELVEFMLESVVAGQLWNGQAVWLSVHFETGDVDAPFRLCEQHGAVYTKCKLHHVIA